VYTLHPVAEPWVSDRPGSKVSFCLLDNTKINTRLPNAPKKAVCLLCNPDIQGISVGWGDTYRYGLDGQSVDFTGNPSGDYLLTIEINPNGNLVESNYTDNFACALLRINREALSVQVLDTTCNPVYGTVTINSITPDRVQIGSQVIVTIDGSGFGNGIDVHFSNGSGKIPVVSNVQVASNGTSITATVKVPTGGSTADPVWDLHVGQAELADALTVVR
jgi:hypothetical protein